MVNNYDLQHQRLMQYGLARE